MGKMIGIDLGTTNSIATYIDETGEIKFIKNEYGNILIPSVVGINEKDEAVVGELAKERRLLNASDSASNFKRRMGTNFKIKIKDREFDAQILSSMVLKHLKECAEKQLNETVDRAIISVPAYFNDKQRKDTKIAAELAGIKVERLINEPTAAALSLGGSILNRNLTFIVLDLGGGTFDVTLLESFEDIMEVKSISGDTMLGGEDFTARICEIALRKMGKRQSELSKKEQTELYTKADRAKKIISIRDVEINIKLDREYKIEITQKEFREGIKPLLVKIKGAIERALKDGNVRADEIEKVILVGGAVRLGIIKEFVEKYFQIMKKKNNSYKNNFEYNDFGDNTSGSEEELVIIAGDPDTAVAYGTGVTVGMKERNRAFSERILTDVCPFSLGIGIIGNRFAPIINRNTTVPTSRTEYFTTVSDNQDFIRLGIYQGESIDLSENLFLGEFEVPVPKNRAGQENIKVRFTYDINGILEVEAIVETTGEKYSKLIINEGLSEEEKNEKIKQLENIKFNEENKNRDSLLLERMNRIHAEISNREIRRYISEYMGIYDGIVATGDKIKIKKIKMEITQFLDKIDPELVDISIDDIMKGDTDENREKETDEDDLEFLN